MDGVYQRAERTISNVVLDAAKAADDGASQAGAVTDLPEVIKRKIASALIIQSREERRQEQMVAARARYNDALKAARLEASAALERVQREYLEKIEQALDQLLSTKLDEDEGETSMKSEVQLSEQPGSAEIERQSQASDQASESTARPSRPHFRDTHNGLDSVSSTSSFDFVNSVNTGSSGDGDSERIVNTGLSQLDTKTVTEAFDRLLAPLPTLATSSAEKRLDQRSNDAASKSFPKSLDVIAATIRAPKANPILSPNEETGEDQVRKLFLNLAQEACKRIYAEVDQLASRPHGVPSKIRHITETIPPDKLATMVSSAVDESTMRFVLSHNRGEKLDPQNANLVSPIHFSTRREKRGLSIYVTLARPREVDGMNIHKGKSNNDDVRIFVGSENDRHNHRACRTHRAYQHEDSTYRQDISAFGGEEYMDLYQFAFGNAKAPLGEDRKPDVPCIQSFSLFNMAKIKGFTAAQCSSLTLLIQSLFIDLLHANKPSLAYKRGLGVPSVNGLNSDVPHLWCDYYMLSKVS